MPRWRPVPIALCLLAVACSGEGDPCDRMHAEVQALMDEKAQAYGFPGLVLGVDTPGCGTWIGATGIASRDPEAPMQPEHIIPIGSVSKIFVAVVVLGLVDDGALSLDDRLSTWHPDVPNAETITIRHLLGHRSGLYNYFPDADNPCYQAYATDPARVWTPDEIIACTDGHEPDFAPGERFGYSNTNYVLLGSIVEGVTGRGLYEEMHDRIFTPLGMDHTFSKAAGSQMGERARCYLGDQDITENFNPTFAFGSGGMESNAADLLAGVREVVTADLLPASMRYEMLACGDSQGFFMGDYGLGIACQDHDTLGRIAGHAGRGDGMAEVFYSEDLETALVVLVNHRFTDAMWNLPTYLWSYDLAGILDEHRALILDSRN